MKDADLMSLMFADAADFRDQLLSDTLRTVRRKRRVRHCGRVLVTMALFAVALWWSLPQRARLNAPVAPSLAIVNTRPTSVEVVTTSSAGLEIVGDEELLDLVPGEGKALVWHAPGDAELVILGP